MKKIDTIKIDKHTYKIFKSDDKTERVVRIFECNVLELQLLPFTNINESTHRICNLFNLLIASDSIREI